MSPSTDKNPQLLITNLRSNPQGSHTGDTKKSIDPHVREVWVSLPRYSLEVSSFGNVRNLDSGKRLRPSFTGRGYVRVNFKRKNLLIHRLVMEAFHGPCPPHHEVNHINNVSSDNRLENLEYVTSSQNTLHAVAMGTWPIGSKRWNSRLTEDGVRKIREMNSNGKSIKEIAGLFEVSEATIYHIIRGHNWKHVK